jgi:hypothetical protein
MKSDCEKAPAASATKYNIQDDFRRSWKKLLGIHLGKDRRRAHIEKCCAVVNDAEGKRRYHPFIYNIMKSSRTILHICATKYKRRFYVCERGPEKLLLLLLHLDVHVRGEEEKSF